MTQVLRTTRALRKETVTVQPFTGRGPQGEPTYAASVQVSANVVESGGGKEDLIYSADGTAVTVRIYLYVEGDAAYLPKVQDRVTWDGRVYIARTRTAPRGLAFVASQRDHVKVGCVDE